MPDSSTVGFSQSSRILVLGAKGMLGHMLVRTLSKHHQVFGTTSGPRENRSLFSKIMEHATWIERFDVNNRSILESTIAKIRPAVIINCIGVVKQRLGQVSQLDAIHLNSCVPHELVALCGKFDTRLIHISTDCVFEGTPGLKLLSDTPNATDLYGASKWLGEVTYGNSLTLRTGFVGRQLTGQDGLFEWVRSQKGQTVRGFTNAIYSGLTTLELSRIIKEVVEVHNSLKGLYQVASSPISKFDLIDRLNVLLELELTVVPEPTFYCDRSLDGTEFTARTRIQVPSWDEMLLKYVEDEDFYNASQENLSK